MMYSKNPNLIEKDTDAGLLIFDTHSGRMMELNSTARLLWKKSSASFGPADLRKIIEAGCTPARDLDSDLADFLKTALKHGLVSENGKD